MALIEIKGRKEKIVIDNMRAVKIKVLRFGDIDGNGAVDPKDGIDLGDWAGEIGMIRSVEIEKSKIYNNDQEPELTPAQKENVRKYFSETREWLKKAGIIKN